MQIRHRCRITNAFDSVCLGDLDHMKATLALEKLCCADFTLLVQCRRRCAFALAYWSTFPFRWIQSELNASDGASRRSALGEAAAPSPVKVTVAAPGRQPRTGAHWHDSRSPAIGLMAAPCTEQPAADRPQLTPESSPYSGQRLPFGAVAVSGGERRGPKVSVQISQPAAVESSFGRLGPGDAAVGTRSLAADHVCGRFCGVVPPWGTAPARLLGGASSTADHQEILCEDAEQISVVCDATRRVCERLGV